MPPLNIVLRSKTQVVDDSTRTKSSLTQCTLKECAGLKSHSLCTQFQPTTSTKPSSSSTSRSRCREISCLSASIAAAAAAASSACQLQAASHAPTTVHQQRTDKTNRPNTTTSERRERRHGGQIRGLQGITTHARTSRKRGERGCARGARMQAVQRLKSLDLQGGMPRPAA